MSDHDDWLFHPVTVRDLLTSPHLGTRRPELTLAKMRELGNERFFREYLEVVQEHYNRYLSFDETNPAPVYVIFYDGLREALLQYLLQLNGQRGARNYSLDIGTVLAQHLYNGFSPSLIRPRAWHGDQALMRGQTFHYRYFLWIKDDDPRFEPADSRTVITLDNFGTHGRSLFDGGWSKLQMQTFISTVIIPRVLQAAGLTINAQHPDYLECMRKHLNTKDALGNIIKHYINTSESIDLNQENFTWEGVIREMPGLIRARGLIYHPYLQLMRMVHCLFEIQNEVRARIRARFNSWSSDLSDIQPAFARITRISNDVAKRRGVKERFHWMNVCAGMDELSADDLRELAAMERIPYYEMMTKDELCRELTQRVREQIEQVNETRGQCSNSESVITLEPIQNIPPEFFYAYRHNGRLYCDDIRILARHFQINGPTHPADRTQLDIDLVNTVLNEYNSLVRRVARMEDAESESESDEQLDTVPNPQSILTMRVASLLDMLRYPHDLQLFMTADAELSNRFINDLVQRHVLGNREVTHILQGHDLIEQKSRLAELLILKITNDPVQIHTEQGVISQIAEEVTASYNTTFIPPPPMTLEELRNLPPPTIPTQPIPRTLDYLDREESESEESDEFDDDLQDILERLALPAARND